MQHDEQSVLEAHEEVDVDHQPRDPREPAGEPEPAYFRHGAAASDGRHLAPVDEPEGLPRLAREIAADRPRHEPALLDRHGRRARKRSAGLAGETGLVARDEHVRVAGYTQVFVDHHATAAV